MAYFIRVSTNAPRNNKEKALQKATEKYNDTITDLSFDELKEGFKRIVDAENEANKRSKEANLNVYTSDAYHKHGLFSISDGNISISCTLVKGTIVLPFGIQTVLNLKPHTMQ